MKPHYEIQSLPSGEKELVLAPIGGHLERLIYWAIVGGLLIGGFVLTPGFMGWAMLGTGAFGGFALYRVTKRREAWRLRPGSATRTVVFMGTKTETFVPERVRALAETDSDERRVLRLDLVHGAGKAQIGTTTFDHDERALNLAKAMGEALGVPVDLPA